MRFLADESCDFRVVRALRAAGHDVKTIIEAAPGAEDEAVLAMALEKRFAARFVVIEPGRIRIGGR
jgi:hypothetical protein